MKPLLLKNPEKNYEWGSRIAIQQLLEKSEDKPIAELWMGAHPNDPSAVYFDSQWVSLYDLIHRFPEKILGKIPANKFHNTLPYLFKILAAAQPLSIQAHPNSRQAKDGFERESKAGLDITADKRNYKDPHHKPECICALTPFSGLKGFRKAGKALTLIERFCPCTLSEAIDILKKKDLKAFFAFLLYLPESRRTEIVAEARESAEKSSDADIISQWLLRLYDQYPDDIGVISPLFLNLFCLEPGQALFLPAGELHAYLDGLGIELMANSDNVIRGGLTRKHVDVPELLQLVNFRESDLDILQPEAVSETEKRYPVLAEEFFLSAIHVSDTRPHISLDTRGAEILICIQGHGEIMDASGKNTHLTLKKGDSILIPAAAAPWQIMGRASFFKAGVPA